MDTTLLSGIFSDETEMFRSPCEPDPDETVHIRIRAPKDSVSRAMLLMFEPQVAILMTKLRSDRTFDWFEACIVCLKEQTRYAFVLEIHGMRIAYTKVGAKVLADGEAPEKKYAFCFTPGFHVPAWAKGAVQYQIFPDRFCNGESANDVKSYEYFYVSGHAQHIDDWYRPVTEPDVGNFYGGDLQGVMQKLDYLQSIGIEVLYFNPIFISPSSHKYDTQDYEHIDPHLAVIEDDEPHAMLSWEHHNGYAKQYIRRTTSAFNLYASDGYFAQLCQEVHRRGMRIILDGVFNHCGSFNKWMDKEGIYVGRSGFSKGAYQDIYSPYRKFFKFTERGSGRTSDYEGWWGFDTLPKLNYEGSEELQEKILEIGEKWVSPPYSVDGWRLDVAADLGHSPEFNHEFWKKFRARVKKANPNVLILAEHYGNASSWLQGDEWDTVMNYDAFMEPVTFFLTGMEKHSDGFNASLYQNGEGFFRMMAENMAKMQEPSLYCAMNELSNHDHSRFLTRTNRTIGRLATAGSEAAEKNISKPVFREAVAIQMTWPGAPTIYYGDEAGQVGWTDPDCRRTYPWGREDAELIALHRDLTCLRREHPVFANGSVQELLAGQGILAYARFNEEEGAIVCVNNTDTEQTIRLDIRLAGFAASAVFALALRTDGQGHSAATGVRVKALSGQLFLDLPPLSASVLIKE